VQLSALRTDATLGQGRLHLAQGDAATAQRDFESCEQVWARSHAGSVWHAQCQHWLAQALRAQGGDPAAAQALQAMAHPVLAACPLASLRALAGAA
jgi:hypothetical protein